MRPASRGSSGPGPGRVSGPAVRPGHVTAASAAAAPAGLPSARSEASESLNEILKIESLAISRPMMMHWHRDRTNLANLKAQAAPPTGLRRLSDSDQAAAAPARRRAGLQVPEGGGGLVNPAVRRTPEVGPALAGPDGLKQ